MSELFKQYKYVMCFAVHMVPYWHSGKGCHFFRPLGS